MLGVRTHIRKRRSRVRTIVIAAMLLASPPTSGAPNFSSEPYAKIINYGIVTNEPKPKAVLVEPSAPSGVLRKFAAKEMAFLETTDRIPAKLGIRFGLAFEIYNLPDVPHIGLRTRVLHPAMKKPDGKTSTEFEYVRRLAVKSGKTYGGTSYRFDEPHEVLPGTWSFEYFLGDTKLFSKNFVVIHAK
jgi:hypothetical protein